jgi:hypothetical protein
MRDEGRKEDVGIENNPHPFLTRSP